MSPSIRTTTTTTTTTATSSRAAAAVPIDDEWFGDQVHDWNEIRHLVSNNKVQQLRRNREGQRVYRHWTETTLSKYKDIEDFLLSEKLHFPTEEPADPTRPHYIVLPNDFPYSTEPGTKHVLIWSQKPLSEPYVREILESHYGSNNWEWVYFVNPPETQSVKRLPHVHVFMRPRTANNANANATAAATADKK
ncbi:hypothetical protein BDB00DRAFT_809787 [Zychaea mexicana]|uniref:uncharacterized protein n=1 Tax=Zychaea mexicana TaxID=64656 RepID=UPI0022FDF4A9|nr:uncharacterized protein BDB00DRAFT_809787 [Zychaea mexicana]KAI9496282.1 hypothetical protein BDB00DRAFT_809787 [Zychaea mexicana]